MTQLTLEPATKQLELLQTGQVSVIELAEAHILQIERLNPTLNALVDFDPDRVRAQARLLNAAKGVRGPLHGLPVTVKSSIATAGYRCETGSLIHTGYRPGEDAEVVRRLRHAGALILGTTNCPEFLMAYETDNRLNGRTLNPWDHTRSPGGSSGGEACAIAAGLSAAGLGSDSGGSVRQPAHATGICALKPTPGRIPSRGHLPPCVGPFSTLGAIGPMARTIPDIMLLFETLCGHDPLEPGSTPIPGRHPTLAELRGQTIGYFTSDGLTPVTSETQQAVHLAAQALSDQGFQVKPIPAKLLTPLLVSLSKLWWKLFVQCGAMFYEPTIEGHQQRLSPIFLEFLRIAAQSPTLTTRDLLAAWADLDLLRIQFQIAMEPYPVLLCPVSSIPAFRHGEREWQVEGKTVHYLEAMRPTQWFNVLGAPSAVVPIILSPENLPIGVQVAAQPNQDETALAIAAVLNQFIPTRSPSCP